ncbi:hypothetical protein C9439_00320 [archaeon SCG-AAA382B04]|nr:hypothetical protein C9439_00320 [archaeon SCG-AAA382B04]
MGIKRIWKRYKESLKELEISKPQFSKEKKYVWVKYFFFFIGVLFMLSYQLAYFDSFLLYITPLALIIIYTGWFLMLPVMIEFAWLFLCVMLVFPFKVTSQKDLDYSDPHQRGGTKPVGFLSL